MIVRRPYVQETGEIACGQGPLSIEWRHPAGIMNRFPLLREDSSDGRSRTMGWQLQQ